MCGRFTVTSEQSYLEDRFSAKFDESFSPRFNAAPSQKLPVITNRETGKIQMYIWGLKPEWWRKMNSRRDGIINVRMETLRDKWTFAKDLKSRRCLVLADGFYEWSQLNGKQPFRITLKTEKPFAMAGIWEVNTIEGGSVSTFSIVTCEANKKLSPMHQRMPVMLGKEEEQDWLGTNDKVWMDLLDTLPAKEIEMYPVSKDVNVSTNDNPAVIKKIKL